MLSLGLHPQRNSLDDVQYEVTQWGTGIGHGHLNQEISPGKRWEYSTLRSGTGNVSFSWIFLGNVLHVSSPLPASLVLAPSPVVLLEFSSSLDKGNPTILMDGSVFPLGFGLWLCLMEFPDGMSVIQPGCILQNLFPRSCKTALIQENPGSRIAPDVPAQFGTPGMQLGLPGWAPSGSFSLG